MHTRFERYIYGSLAVLALLLVAMLFAPSVAQAEGYQSTVVGSGESLWTVSAERLGPNATAQEIAQGVERIYALNRERIGTDPDEIPVGLELLLPADAAEASPPGPQMVRMSARTAPVGREAPARAEAVAARPAAVPLGLPDPPPPVHTPTVRPLSAAGTPDVTAMSALAGYFAELRAELSGGAQADGREALGLGILVLTFLTASLMLWKLPMKRDSVGWRAAGVRVGTQAYASYANSPPHPASQRVYGRPLGEGGHTQASTPPTAAAEPGSDSPTPGRGEGFAVPYRLAPTAHAHNPRRPQRTRMPGPGVLAPVRRRRPLHEGPPARGRQALSGNRSPRAALRDRRRRSKSRENRNATGAPRGALRSIGGR